MTKCGNVSVAVAEGVVSVTDANGEELLKAEACDVVRSVKAKGATGFVEIEMYEPSQGRRAAKVQTIQCGDEAAADQLAGIVLDAAKVSVTASHVHVVVNPNSGTGKAVQLSKKVEAVLSALGIPHSVKQTNAPRHAVELGEEIAKNWTQGSVICCVGGDGVVHEVVNGIQASGTDSRVTLALIPAGSGNGMAGTLGLKTTEDAIWTAVKGTPAPLDAMAFDQPNPCNRKTGEKLEPGSEPTKRSAFLQMCFGIIADVDFESEWLRAIGYARFPVTAVWKILWMPKYRARLKMVALKNTEKHKEVWEPKMATQSKACTGTKPFTADTSEGDDFEVVEFEDDFTMINTSNVAFISDGMLTNPYAKLSDGLLDVALVRRSKLSRFQLIDYFNKVETPTGAAATPYTEFFKVKSLTLTPLTPTAYTGKIDLDGEWAPHGPVTLTVCPASLNVMSPF